MEEGAVRFHLPTVVAPRYVPKKIVRLLALALEADDANTVCLRQAEPMPMIQVAQQNLALQLEASSGPVDKKEDDSKGAELAVRVLCCSRSYSSRCL